MPKRKTIRHIQPWERLPMHHAEEVGGAKEVALIEEPDGEFRIQTRDHEYPLDADDDEPKVVIEAEKVFIINKAQIKPDDIKRLSSLDEAGIRGGIHSKRTYLMALKDGSLWIWKQTGNEERDEIFVYHLAQLMFRGIVPEVQPVYVPRLGWGSAMRKVAGIPAGRVDGLHGYFHGNEEMQADLVAMLVLDYLTGNPDRHANNWFIMHNDRLAAIDNGWAGEDPVMTLSAVFEPADLAGLVRDESLWPKMLQMMLELINDLTGRGDEARALAQDIAIDRKEAVAMVRLWEPKLQRMARFIQAEASKLTKEKVYIEPGTQPPLGVQVETGPRGGTYYESEGIPAGMEEVEREPVLAEFEPQPMTAEAMTEAEMFNDGTLGGWLEEYKVSNDVGEVGVRETMKNDIVSMIVEKTGLDYATINAYIKAWAGSATQSQESLAMQHAAAEMFDLEKNDYITGLYQWGTEEDKIRMHVNASHIVKAMYDETQAWLKEHGVTSLVLFRGMRWTEDEVPAEVAKTLRWPTPRRGEEIEFHANPLSSWSSNPLIAEEFANYSAEGADEGGEPDFGNEEYVECLQNEQDEARNSAREDAAIEAENIGEEFNEEEFENNFDDNYDSDIQNSACEPPYVYPDHVRSIAVAKVPADKVIAMAITGLGCLNEDEIVVAGGKQNVSLYSARSGADEQIQIQDFIDSEAESEAERPKTPEEFQEAQKEEWFAQTINPLFARMHQQQKALKESYELKIDAVPGDDPDAPYTGKAKAEIERLRQEYWELHHEIQADSMAEGKVMIEAAGYLPEGGWETAEEAPLSPELAAWREDNYEDWVKTNLADDASKWVDRRNEMEVKVRHTRDKLKGSTLPPNMKKERIDKLDAQFKLAMDEVNADYYRLGAKKLREAGFEPRGYFAMQEALDAKAGK